MSFSGWKTASRVSSGISPTAKKYKPAVVQVYAAKLWGIRGLVADHTWISTKKAGATSYKVYEVLDWLKHSTKSNSVVRIAEDMPDRLWYRK